MKYRVEHDSMGEVQVPADHHWGAQTQRALANFRIGGEQMPCRLIYGLAWIKRTCAQANREFGLLDAVRCEAIVSACDEILAGAHDREFPLSPWQTGSGTQTNMNVNEVVASLARQILGDRLPAGGIHPNDHVNLSQSTNDVFPSAMHIAALMDLEDSLLPALAQLEQTLAAKAAQFADIIKIGRTHLQDATPLTLGQEVGAWVSMVQAGRQQILATIEPLRALAIGGTAVGTGLNAPAGFGDLVASLLAAATGRRFHSAPDKFHALTSHDALVWASGALKALAANLMKIANDVRWLASGPRCGIGELSIPANEPGSSIMPGKVNPTQAEVVTMVACQVFGNDAVIAFAASQGNFQLNVFKPLIITNFLQSTGLLADVLRTFNDHCATGIEPVRATIDRNLHRSLMLATALNPHIGYEKAAQIAHAAHRDNITLREAAVRSGLLSGEEFDRWVVAEAMVGPLPGTSRDARGKVQAAPR